MNSSNQFQEHTHGFFNTRPQSFRLRETKTFVDNINFQKWNHGSWAWWLTPVPVTTEQGFYGFSHLDHRCSEIIDLSYLIRLFVDSGHPNTEPYVCGKQCLLNHLPSSVSTLSEIGFHVTQVARESQEPASLSNTAVKKKKSLSQIRWKVRTFKVVYWLAYVHHATPQHTRHTHIHLHKDCFFAKHQS